MTSRIEDYALLGDCRSAALVGKDGAVDWLCLPRFDADACFAALLGTEENGSWKIAPTEPVTAVRRRYREGTLVLETELVTAGGTLLLVDFMPVGDLGPGLVRIARCTGGSVAIRSVMALRFNFGRTVPWVQKRGEALEATCGPDRVQIAATIPLRGEEMRTVGEVTLREGESAAFAIRWSSSFAAEPPPLPPAEEELARTEAFWTDWSASCRDLGPYTPAIRRSLLTLKALTFAPTGGIVAAPTTSLPEALGSVRNWDYRYCWLRDATFTLFALLNAGFMEEAHAWRNWLVRVAAGSPEQLQILYGIAGERRIVESELDWLAGYEGSRPVRVGNAAADQLQLDVYGELADAFHTARKAGLGASEEGWRIGRLLLEHLETAWREPDHGIWEVRGPRRHFVHSKVMCWVAFDRAIKGMEEDGLDGPLERWRAVRDTIHDDICTHGIAPRTGAFAQYYGSDEPDASLLLLPVVGFLPPDDPRIVKTIASVERELLVDGFVQRYVTHQGVDGLPPGEGAFLACSFWYVDALVLLGREDEARAHFERLLGLANDVGLLAEEYDGRDHRMLGNFPQALSHVALVSSAMNLTRHHDRVPMFRGRIV